MGWPTVRRVAAAGLVGLLVPGAVGAAGIAGATGAVGTARDPDALAPGAGVPAGDAP